MYKCINAIKSNRATLCFDFSWFIAALLLSPLLSVVCASSPYPTMRPLAYCREAGEL